MAREYLITKRAAYDAQDGIALDLIVDDIRADQFLGQVLVVAVPG